MTSPILVGWKISLRRLVCDKLHINKRDAVIENISFWEDSITAKLQFAVCYRWAITSYHLFQQTSLGAWIFSVAACRQNLTDLCVSVRFNTAEAINECNLKPAKRRQERFISVEKLSNITINFANLWSVSILCSPSQCLLLRDLARALRARTLTKWVRFWIWALLQNNRAEKLGNLIKVKATLTLSKMPPQGD